MRNRRSSCDTEERRATHGPDGEGERDASDASETHEAFFTLPALAISIIHCHSLYEKAVSFIAQSHASEQLFASCTSAEAEAGNEAIC